MKLGRCTYIFSIAVVLIAAKWGGYPFLIAPDPSFVGRPASIEPTHETRSEIDDFSDHLFIEILEHLHCSRIFIPRSELSIIISAVMESSERYGFDPELIFSLIQKESSFKSSAISAKGAIGLMQVLPSTAQFLAGELEIEYSGEETLLDPVANIEIGTYYLYKLLHNFKDLDTALSAYNIGPSKTTEIKGNAPTLKTDFSLGVQVDQAKLSLQAYR